MEEQMYHPGMLDLMTCPVFCVKENTITACNPAARGLTLSTGEDIRKLLLTGQEEYAAFTEGVLYLTLSIHGQSWGASVIAAGEKHLFLLEEAPEQPELRSLALAARELRMPLNNVMLLANSIAQELPEGSDKLNRLNRGVHQLLRIVGNMSDAGSCGVSHPETRNIPAAVREIFEKANLLTEQAGYPLTYQGLDEELYGLIDAQQLERAVLNILSNSMKFTPKGAPIQAQLTRSGATLRLSIQDSGSGIGEELMATLFRRYLRQPGIEDSRFGIGLGMVMIRSAAASHGGTVLIDQPREKGTRVTITFAIRQDHGNLLRNRLHVDYAGEWDHALVELADCLPPELYKK